MHMSQFVVREAIVPDLKADTKEGVIREMVESLKASGQLPTGDAEDVVKAILKRETLGSTGIGRGVAIPHTRHPSVRQLTGTVAVSRKGVSFESLDGELVYVFVMLVSPQDQPGQHLRALENVSRCLRDDHFVNGLKTATTREGIWKLLDEAGSQPS